MKEQETMITRCRYEWKKNIIHRCRRMNEEKKARRKIWTSGSQLVLLQDTDFALDIKWQVPKLVIAQKSKIEI